MAPEGIKVSNSGFRSILGLEPTKNVEPTSRPENITFLQRFSPSEGKAILQSQYVQPEVQRSNLSAAGIISYLKPIHKAIGEQMLNVDKMRALAPEIEQSRILVSSSIMSPNDLQDGMFRFTFEDVPGIDSDPDLVKEIQEVYEQHFNKTLQLGIKSYDWIGDIQYSSGAKPILILPNATLLDLKRHGTPDDPSNTANLGTGIPGFASFEDMLQKSAVSDDFLYSGKAISWADVFEKQTAKVDLAEMVPSMESFGVEVPAQFKTNISRKTPNADEDNDKYVASMESMIVNLRKRLEEGDIIRVTENPEIVKFATQKSLVDKQTALSNIKKKYQLSLKDVFPIEEVVTLKANPDDINHHGHPAIIELPTESVIPIHVPGAPKEHYGYFILLDNYGQPLTIQASGMANSAANKGCSPGSANGAYETLFGSGCSAVSYFGNDPNGVNSAGNMIFQHLLDKYIKARIKGIFGRDDLELSRFSALSTVMFYRLLQRKRTTLVYCPPSLLHYFAFDYRKNGTGRSKIEDIQFLLSLRTTLMMAQIVAMVNDAVEHKKIELGIDDNAANLEGIMELVANIFIEKNKLSGSIDPSEIMRDMYSNALTIVPKNIPGLGDMTVDVTNQSGQSTKPDNELLEQLTNLMVSHLDVPPSALNQLAEPEFARSLTTYNLFFAKKITRYQYIFCSQMSDFVKDYTQFSAPFQKALMKKLQAAGKKRAKAELPDKAKKITKKNPNEYDRSTLDLLKSILDNVTVSLPKPNIVVDKTQFEEIRSFMSNLEEMANNLFPNELVPTDDQNATAALPVVRASWKREQMLHFIENVGSFNMVTIPDMDEFDVTDLIDFIQTLQNTASALKQQRDAIGNAGEEGGFGGDAGFGGGMGDESMGDDMGGMGEGDDMGMDMGGDTSADSMPPENEVRQQDIKESESPESTSEENSPTATMYARHFKR